MPRPKIPPEEKALRELRAQRELLEADIRDCQNYQGEFWDDYRQNANASLGKINSAIHGVEQNGLPEGWAEKWGKQ